MWHIGIDLHRHTLVVAAIIREVTRHRTRLAHGQTQVKQGLRCILARHNLLARYKYPFGPRGLYWFSRQDFGLVDNPVRDELLARLAHYSRELGAIDARLAKAPGPKFA